MGVVSAPGYSDENAYDAVSKALDIYGVADMAINMSEIPLPALIEGGMIVTGTLAAIAAPFVAIGAGHNDALKNRSRQHFFIAFCSTFIMTADGRSTEKVDNFYPQRADAPKEMVYPEKRETFRKLYNLGLKAGRLLGSRTNTVGRRNLFVLLRSRLNDTEARNNSGDVKDWSVQKKRDYYDRLASILKQIMLDNDLQIKFR